MNLIDANFPYSFNLAICMLVHLEFSSQMDTYLIDLKSIQTKEIETSIDNPKIIDIFSQIL